MSRMKLGTIIAVTITSLSLFVTAAFAQQNPREIFERARMLDESNQNLSEAIKLYGQVVSQSNEQRALAARAQYRIGVLYERLGRKGEAQRAFQTVVKQYGDQSEVAGRARAKLPSPVPKANSAKSRSATNEATTTTNRQLWAGADVDTEGALSPDGRYLSFVDKKGQGDLAIRDLITESRRVTNDSAGHCPDCGEESIWSPDGKQIVYGWLSRENSDKYKAEAVELRIIGIDGSGKRVLYRPDGPIYAWPSDWSSDGKYILARLDQDKNLQIALISVADSDVRAVKTLSNWNGSQFGRMFFSPDGRYIVYSASVKEGSPARDIFLLSIDGSREIPLVQRAADDYALGWTPDGRGVLFASDHSGVFDMWFVPVADGQTQGYPEVVKRNIGKIEPMGLTRKGSLLYSVGGETSNALVRDVYIATIDSKTGRPLADLKPAIHRYVGSNLIPAWSPDGRQLAIRSLTKPTNTSSDPAILSLVNVETGAEREIRPNLPAMIGGFHWTHDGRFLLAAGRNDRDAKDRQGIYKIDAQTGETNLLIPAQEGTWIHYPISSPDGKSLFYLSSKGAIIAHDMGTGEDRTLFEARRADSSNNQAFLLTSLTLSRDGQWLAFRYQKSADASLMVMSAKGGEFRELFHAGLVESINTARSIAWTPDGRYLLFVMRSGRRDPYQLWRVPVEGGKPENLGLTRPELSNLSMNPDGRRIAFAAGQTVNSEIWVMENFLPKQNAKEQSRPVMSRKR